MIVREKFACRFVEQADEITGVTGRVIHTPTAAADVDRVTFVKGAGNGDRSAHFEKAYRRCDQFFLDVARHAAFDHELLIEGVVVGAHAGVVGEVGNGAWVRQNFRA